MASSASHADREFNYDYDFEDSFDYNLEFSFTHTAATALALADRLQDQIDAADPRKLVYIFDLDLPSACPEQAEIPARYLPSNSVAAKISCTNYSRPSNAALSRTASKRSQPQAAGDALSERTRVLFDPAWLRSTSPSCCPPCAQFVRLARRHATYALPRVTLTLPAEETEPRGVLFDSRNENCQKLRAKRCVVSVSRVRPECCLPPASSALREADRMHLVERPARRALRRPGSRGSLFALALAARGSALLRAEDAERRREEKHEQSEGVAATAAEVEVEAEAEAGESDALTAAHEVKLEWTPEYSWGGSQDISESDDTQIVPEKEIRNETEKQVMFAETILDLSLDGTRPATAPAELKRRDGGRPIDWTLEEAIAWRRENGLIWRSDGNAASTRRADNNLPKMGNDTLRGLKRSLTLKRKSKEKINSSNKKGSEHVEHVKREAGWTPWWKTERAQVPAADKDTMRSLKRNLTWKRKPKSKEQLHDDQEPTHAEHIGHVAEDKTGSNSRWADFKIRTKSSIKGLRKLAKRGGGLQENL